MKLFGSLKDKIGSETTGILSHVFGIFWKGILWLKKAFLDLFRALYDGLDDIL